MLGVREYLAAAKLGEVTPLTFMRHVNRIILPALDIGGQNVTISESTAQRWLIQLGYKSCEVKKGLYIDGHERPDVVKSRATFLKKMSQLRWFVSHSNIVTAY